MTLQQLQERVTIGTCLQGHFKVTIEYRGKLYSCTSTDTMMYDRIRHDDVATGYTEKQAYQSLYDFCKYKNNL